MNRIGSLLMWFMALLMAAFVAGCGGGDDEAGPVGPAAPIGNIAGVWAITETGTTANNPVCESPPGGNNGLDSYNLTVTQTGNDLTVAREADPAVAGTIVGDQMTWSGASYPELGGITTITSASVTVAAGCNSLSGSFNWTYVEDAPGVLTCTGNTIFTGTEPAASGC